MCSIEFLATSFPSNVQHAGAALAQARTIRLEVKDYGVLARFQFGPLPHRALEVEQVIEEHDPAPVQSQLALAQEQAITAKASAVSDDQRPPKTFS